MKLFLATNELTLNTPNIKMLEVAVNSALKNTNFEIYVIFDGKKKNLTLPEKVKIITHKHRCYKTFKNSKKCKTVKNCLQISSSTFLRTEIPYLLDVLNDDDEFILYTDYDVIFLPGDYSDLNILKPKIFASCPEYEMNDWSYINAGVMLMNINFLKNEDNKILNFINKNFENLETWDQTMYNHLYLNEGINKLPLLYNWKPYWGINEKAKIIHFHGIKPINVLSLSDLDSNGNLKDIYIKNKKSYDYYNNLFNSFL